MRNLYVIVHEECVDNAIKAKVPGAEDAKQGIEYIRQTIPAENIFGLYDFNVDVPEDLPAPAQDLTIVLMGAYTQMCVSVAQLNHEKKGYKTELYLPGCLDQTEFELTPK